MKSLMAIVAACLALCAAGAAYAQSAQGADAVKIGFIDVDRILRESAPAERSLQKLKKEFSSREQELQRLQQQAKSLQEQLDKNGLTMADSERSAREQELSRLSVDLQRKQRDFQVDVNQRQNEELAALRDRTGLIIKQIAEADKYDLILTEAVYRSPAIDITDKVLKALAAEK